MNDYQKRVLNEFTELEEKIKKLGLFLDTEVCNNLSGIERSLLISQMEAMMKYAEILAMRTSLFELINKHVTG